MTFHDGKLALKEFPRLHFFYNLSCSGSALLINCTTLLNYLPHLRENFWLMRMIYNEISPGLRTMLIWDISVKVDLTIIQNDQNKPKVIPYLIVKASKLKNVTFII